MLGGSGLHLTSRACGGDVAFNPGWYGRFWPRGHGDGAQARRHRGQRHRARRRHCCCSAARGARRRDGTNLGCRVWRAPADSRIESGDGWWPAPISSGEASTSSMRAWPTRRPAAWGPPAQPDGTVYPPGAPCPPCQVRAPSGPDVAGQPLPPRTPPIGRLGRVADGGLALGACLLLPAAAWRRLEASTTLPCSSRTWT